MIGVLKHHIYLTLIFLFFLLGGWFFIQNTTTNLVFSQYALTCCYIFMVSQGVVWLFFRGLRKSPDKGILYTFVSISAKFILYLIYLIVFRLVTKNLTLDYIIGFFVLYLAFTFYTLVIMVKTLKNKQL